MFINGCLIIPTGDVMSPLHTLFISKTLNDDPAYINAGPLMATDLWESYYNILYDEVKTWIECMESRDGGHIFTSILNLHFEDSKRKACMERMFSEKIDNVYDEWLMCSKKWKKYGAKVYYQVILHMNDDASTPGVHPHVVIVGADINGKFYSFVTPSGKDQQKKNTLLFGNV